MVHRTDILRVADGSVAEDRLDTDTRDRMTQPQLGADRGGREVRRPPGAEG